MLLFGIAFLWQLGSIGLVDETEPLFAEAARQMHVTGNWITPYFNEQTRFDKPPLIYWLMAITYRILGVNEWAARLPSSLSAMALVGLSFNVIRRFGCPSLVNLSSHAPQAQRSSSNFTAWVSTIILILTPEMILWGRLGVSDMLLTGCMGTALLTFFVGYAHPNPSQQQPWYLTCFILLALAVLAKGPVGIVLPVLIILTFLLYVGQLRRVLQEMPLLLGSGLFLLLTVPWYVLVIVANGKTYLDSFFGYHNIERFTSVVNNHSAPWYFYFVVVLLGFAPWSAGLPWAIARLQVWRLTHWRQQARADQLGLFALSWFGGIFLFFTFAVTKLPSYVLPLMPAAAILVGGLYNDHMTQPLRSRWAKPISVIILLILLIALSGASFYSPNWLGDDPAMPNMPQLVQQSGVMFRGGIIFAGGAITTLILLWRHLRWLWLVNLITMVLFLVLTLLPAAQLMDKDRQQPLRQIAATLQQQQQPAEQVLQMSFKPSLVFYAHHPVTFLYSANSVQAKLQEIWKQAEPSALLVGLPQDLQALNLDPQRSQILHQTQTYKLIRVLRP